MSEKLKAHIERRAFMARCEIREKSINEMCHIAGKANFYIKSQAQSLRQWRRKLNEGVSK